MSSNSNFLKNNRVWQEFISAMYTNSYKKGTERKPMEAKKFAIFMNNGDIITIDAATFTWADDDTLVFYDASINDNIVAIFKQNALFGVSECCFELHEKQLMLPKFEEGDT